MEEKLLRNLEFDRILQQVASYAATISAAEQIKKTEPIESKDRLNTMLDLLKEAYDLSYTKGRVSVHGYQEANDLVLHAKKGGVVREGGLIRIASDLRIAKDVKKHILPEQYSNISYPLLEEIASELEGVVHLEKEISRAIISEDEISDHASGELYDIRRKIRDANATVKEKLQKLIHSKENKKYLQEELVTIRNGRYVVPVKNENKAQVPGIVHEASASGLTLFVEPMAVVNLNNQLRELEAAEKKEIERILKLLSEQVAKSADYLLNNERILIFLDELFAKAEYAVVSNHAKPELVEVRQIHLRKAFHPLIPKEAVVASDITIGEGYSQMVITGPNTGGKTVTLKTLGLCCLMAQCGLFIPAAQGSQLCLFDQIFADIGDEQSIAQSLSTFSSHMTNIVNILSRVNARSLVLLDELGAGTDPSEGAALAWAILSEIKDAGAISLATTHYNEIKHYALVTEGVINASVEFDVENLKPTYRLQIGIPGKSNAFEISRKLGLNEEILSRAETVLSRGSAEFDEIIGQLQGKLASAAVAYDEAQALSVENESINASLKTKRREFESEKDKLLSDAAVEAKRIISDAKRRAKEMMSEAERQYHPDVNEKATRKAKIDKLAKEGLDDANRLIAPHRVLKEEEPETSHAFTRNEEVSIPDLKAEGVILSIEGEHALVQVGAIKTKLPLSKLRPKKAKKQTSYSYSGMKAMSVRSKLDIRGITATEVAIEVEKYLDDASLAGLKTVTIVHGKGNGILRKEVDRVLAVHPLVEKHRIGGLKEGGDGATVVYLE